MTDEYEIGESDESSNEKWIEAHGRICSRCDNAVTLSSRHRYCQPCRDEAMNERISRRSRRTMTEAELALARDRERRRNRAPNPGHDQKYGHTDRTYRKQWKHEVDAGRAKCARCGQPILKGQLWDLGHVDGDSSRYAGPEHANSKDCPRGGNRATAKRDRQHARKNRSRNS